MNRNPAIKPALCEITPERVPTGILVAKAWGTSRPQDDNHDIEKVINIDVPVNEIEDFILKIKAPIIFREMLFTLRDHVAWAQTSRVENLEEWEVPFGYENHEDVLYNYESMIARKAGREAQDNFREMLPLVYMTTFTVKFSARTLVRIKDTIGKWLDDNFRPVPHTISGIMAGAFLDIYHSLETVIEQTIYGSLPRGVYGFIDMFPKLVGEQTNNMALPIGDFVYVYVQSVPITLRAQIVRHRPIMFTDNMMDYMTDDGLAQCVASRVQMSLMMPITMAKAMVAKRNCWIAQEDLWRPVIEPLQKLFGAEGKVPLPCDGKGMCPVARDNELRHMGKDPAPACPIWYNFARLWPTTAQEEAMGDYAAKRTLTHPFWMKKIQDMPLDDIPF